MEDETKSFHGPLAGVRVVDLTGMVFGPHATRIMADNGRRRYQGRAAGRGLRRFDPHRLAGELALFGQHRHRPVEWRACECIARNTQPFVLENRR